MKINGSFAFILLSGIVLVASAFSQRVWADEHKGNEFSVAEVLQARAGCKRVNAASSRALSAMYPEWKDKVGAAAVEKLENSAEFQRGMESQQIAQGMWQKYLAHCDSVLVQMQNTVNGVDPSKPITPDMIWVMFLQSLKDGNMEAGEDLTIGVAHDKVKALYAKYTRIQLKNSADHFELFKMKNMDDESAKAVVTRKGREPGLIYFRKSGEGWRLEKF